MLSSQATAKKHASVGYASVEVKDSVHKKPALPSEATAKKHASVGYAMVEVNENVGRRPRLSSEALIDKPALMDGAAAAVTKEDSASEPELSPQKKADKVPARPSIPRPQDSLKVRASLEKPQEDPDSADAVEVAQRPSVPRRQGSLAYTPPKVCNQYNLFCLKCIVRLQFLIVYSHQNSTQFSIFLLCI